MRANSLALRLFVTATGWTVVILFATAVLLSSLYRQAVERAFDHRLSVYMRSLVSDLASPDTPANQFPQSLGEPLFELPGSGWYWQVIRSDGQKKDVRSSRSLQSNQLPRLRRDLARRDETQAGYVEGPQHQNLREIERNIDLGRDGHFIVAVAGDASEIDDETDAFNQALAITLGALAVVLILTTVFQVRFGLAPLKRISESLTAIRSGAADRLEGNFPEEIAPLARETNALLDANRQIVERARTHVGNLAHALKTPLSVVVNEAAARGEDPLAAKVREQADIMRDQIARHLERARLAARVTSIATLTDVAPVVTSLARSMEKIYHDKGIDIAVEAPDQAKFLGERQDLEEMVGNLLDNACKWASSHVTAKVTRASGAGNASQVHITVDDDGRGLSPSERERVAQRGARLDESKPGSGLGLSIVVELAALYGGSLRLGSAPIGGLRAELVLPAG
ncbi:MAG TPA: ATP-binding protein [Xanthobacteraceae bacterium]|nr:ATP-binding protein [Xanthobacteraceae bacterium]